MVRNSLFALALCAAAAMASPTRAESTADCEAVLKAAQGQLNALLQYQLVTLGRQKAVAAGAARSSIDDELVKASGMVDGTAIRAFVPAFRRLCPETAAKMLPKGD